MRTTGFRARALSFGAAAAALASSAILLSASTCNGGGGGNEAALLRAFVASYTDAYLAPSSATLVATAEELQAAVAPCSEKTQTLFLEEDIAQSETAFGATNRAWGALALARFGPFDEPPLRLEPKIDGGPVDRDVVDDAITEMHTAETLRAVGANRRGLPAVGYVLHDVMRQPELDPTAYTAACRYLQAATADVVYLAGQWNTGFFGPEDGWAKNLTAPEQSEVIDDHIAAMTLILQNTGDALYIAREDGLVAPRGSAPEGDLNLGALLARPSRQTFARLDATVAAAERVVRDGGEGQTAAAALYATRVDSAEADIGAAFDAYWEARALLSDDLEDELTNHLDEVNALADAMRGITTLILSDIMGGLGLAVRFTDADGD